MQIIKTAMMAALLLGSGAVAMAPLEAQAQRAEAGAKKKGDGKGKRVGKGQRKGNKAGKRNKAEKDARKAAQAKKKAERAKKKAQQAKQRAQKQKQRAKNNRKRAATNLSRKCRNKGFVRLPECRRFNAKRKAKKRGRAFNSRRDLNRNRNALGHYSGDRRVPLRRFNNRNYWRPSTRGNKPKRGNGIFKSWRQLTR